MQIDPKFLEVVHIERTRLEQNSFPDFIENGMGQNYIVKCNGNAPEVKDLVRQVLLIVNHVYSKPKWPNLDEWLNLLPIEFICNFVPEPTSEETDIYMKWWFSLSYKKKLQHSQKKQKWSLGDWLAWMEPSERLWFWWGATEIGEKTKQDYFLLSINLLDDLYLTGALEVLFEYCGALSIELYEPEQM